MRIARWKIEIKSPDYGLQKSIFVFICSSSAASRSSNAA
jgi:hypothetical protein